jgi:hypothetical protein
VRKPYEVRTTYRGEQVRRPPLAWCAYCGGSHREGSKEYARHKKAHDSHVHAVKRRTEGYSS